ncbi:unnamed protein product, partial [Linum tenue]
MSLAISATKMRQVPSEIDEEHLFAELAQAGAKVLLICGERRPTPEATKGECLVGSTFLSMA